MQRAIWWAAFLIFALVCFGAWAAWVLVDRADTLAEAETRLGTTARLLDEHAARALEAGDNAVLALTDAAAGWDMKNPAHGSEIHRRLQRLIEGSPQISSAWMLDADGNAVLENWRYPPQSSGSFAHRSYFQIHRNGHAGLHIGPSDTGTVTGRQRFTISRSIVRPDGSFGGLAIAGIFSDYFAGVYAEAGLGSAARLRLRKNTGELLAAWPPDQPLEDPQAAWAAAQESGLPSGVFRLEDRLYAYSRVANFPVTMILSQPVAEVLATWRGDATRTGIAALLGVVGFAGLTALGLRGARRETAARVALEQANSGLEERVRQRTRELEESERQLRLVTDAMPAAIAYADADQRYRFVSAGYRSLMGLEPESMLGRTVHEIVGDATYAVARPNIARVLAGERVSFENKVPHPGGRRDCQLHYVPHRAEGGRIVGYFSLMLDITEQKRNEQRQRLLMSELDHRVRNTLATIQAMVQLTARGEGGKEEFAAELQGRIAALARTQGRLTANAWAGAHLRAIAEDELAPYAKGGEGQLDIAGPDLLVKPKAASSLSLVLHELATNAAKHGALSRPEGRIALAWEIVANGHEPALRLSWRERGGPMVRPPARRGFGSLLVERVIRDELGAGSALDFDPAGLTCRIEIPRERVAAEAEPAPAPVAAGLRSGEAQPAPLAVTGGRVLVVEDEALVAAALERSLASAGLEVVATAASVADAMAALDQTRPDAVVMDINLGGETSFPVAERLQAEQVPFLFVSGYQSSLVLPDALKSVPCLQKPLSAESLRRAIARLAPAAPPDGQGTEPAEPSCVGPRGAAAWRGAHGGREGTV